MYDGKKEIDKGKRRERKEKYIKGNEKGRN